MKLSNVSLRIDLAVELHFYSIVKAIKKRSFAILPLLLFALGFVCSETAANTSFEACRDPHRDRSSTDLCHRDDPSSLETLFRTRRYIDNVLQADIDRVRLYQSFTKALQKKVLADLAQLKASYLLMANCPEGAAADTSCAKALESLRAVVRKDWPVLVTELAIARPTQVDPGMMNTRAGWYNTHPAHLFHTSEKITPLKPEVLNKVEGVFIERLKEKAPEMRELLDSQKDGVLLVATNEREKTIVLNAMVQVRKEARSASLEVVKNNPILTFIGNVDTDRADSPSSKELKGSTSRFVDEIEKEIRRLSGESREAHKMLLSYKASAEALLQDNPSWCTAAETAASVMRKEERNTDLKVAAIQIGASVLALGTCSTIILCGAAAGIIGAIDFHITQSKADENFRRGVIHAAIGESKETLTLSAAQNQSASTALVLAVVGTAASGAGAMKSATEKTAKSLSTWDRAAQKTTPPEKWGPKNTAEMQAYSSLHIREVRSNSVRFFKQHRDLFQNATSGQLKYIRKHDLEKVLEFNELSKNYGYRGVPKEIAEDLFEFGDLIGKKSRDGKFIELSIADSLKMLWGHSHGSLNSLAQGAKTMAERKHWDAMIGLRNHVINAMEKIDDRIMADSYSKVQSPAARVELRLIEFISDLSARKANPITASEFGRSITPTAVFIKAMGREKLVQKIAGSDSPIEIHAARRLLDKVTMDDIARMATELEGTYKSSGLPTSLNNTILFQLHGR